MTRPNPRMVGALLGAYALLWPWDVYLYVPGLGVGLDGLVELGLVLVALVDTVVARRLRVPFEVMLPAVVAMGAGLWLAATAVGISPASVLRATALVIAVAHLTPGVTMARRLMVLSALSVALLAAASLAFRVADTPRLLPTAYSLASGASAYGARTPGAAGWALAIGAAVAAWQTARGGAPRWAGAGWIGAAGLCLAELALVVKPALDTPLLGLSPLNVPGIAAAAALAWLLSRIAAKHVVLMQEERRLDSVLFLAVLAVTAVAALWAAPAYGPQAVLVALAAAAARRHEEHLPIPPSESAAALLLLPLVAYNALYVWPGNAGDPRNYAALAAQDMAGGDYATLDARLDYVQRLSPEEQATWLWRADAALRQDEPVEAATLLVAAVAPPKPGIYTVLPPPTKAEAEPLRTRLRDALSQQTGPPAHVAHERFLVALDEVESAVNLLRRRLPDALPEGEAAHRDAFARALAFLMGDTPDVKRALEGWTAPELWGILEQVGARVERAPGAGLESPVALCARPEADAVTALVWTGESETPSQMPALLASEHEVAHGLRWRSDIDTSETSSILLQAGEEPLLHVDVRPDGTLAVSDLVRTAPVTVLAGTPAVLILLPDARHSDEGARAPVTLGLGSM